VTGRPKSSRPPAADRGLPQPRSRGPSGLPRVRLRKNLAKSIHAGHPWLFRDAVESDGPLADGAVVLIANADGRALGRGFWTATTPIAVRMLTTDAADAIPALVPARLREALQRRLTFIDRARTNAFRWVNGEADRLPGLHLDVYAAVASVRFDGPGARAFYLDPALDFAGAVMTAGAALGLTALIERHRGARANADGPAASEAGLVLAGALPTGELVVLENGLRFGVDLLHGQKGGLFLDQRDNRARVETMAAGLRVLNLFGYTGGFSVYAARGGARATTTVDVAPGAIAAAARNFVLNGFAPEAHACIAADVFAFLRQAIEQKRTWDLVISDPPSFAPSRRALPAAIAAYERLHGLCAQVVAPQGIFCAASCSSHVDEATFIRTVTDGVARARRHFALREVHGAGADHPVAPFFPEGRYLKFAIGTMTLPG
jgi:23S rRNA (cytosine1962-C5)-methyltransferase